jgi:hypothetical protein
MRRRRGLSATRPPGYLVNCRGPTAWRCCGPRVRPSYRASYETFRLVVVETFARGVPVVATRLGALEELVDDGETGALVEPGDPEGLRKAVSMVSVIRSIR